MKNIILFLSLAMGMAFTFKAKAMADTSETGSFSEKDSVENRENQQEIATIFSEVQRQMHGLTDLLSQIIEDSHRSKPFQWMNIDPVKNLELTNQDIITPILAQTLENRDIETFDQSLRKLVVSKSPKQLLASLLVKSSEGKNLLEVMKGSVMKASQELSKEELLKLQRSLDLILTVIKNQIQEGDKSKTSNIFSELFLWHVVALAVTVLAENLAPVILIGAFDIISLSLALHKKKLKKKYLKILKNISFCQEAFVSQ